MAFLGIAVPALLVILGVRRWVAPVPWRIAALFLVLTLAFLHGAVFTSRLPVPVDEVVRGDPWRGVVGPVTPRNPLANDAVKLFLPWMQVVREELAHGRVPLWNRYAFSGYPLLANGESAPFSPLFLATLFVPLPKQIVAMAGLKIFLALLFTYLLLRREGLSDGASVFGAVTYAFCVFQTVFLYYSTTAVTSLLPAAAFALLNLIERPAKPGLVLLVIVVATLLANGHPESVLHVAIGCAALMLLDRQFNWMGLRRAVVAVLIALAIAAPAWLPVLEQIGRSERYAELRAPHAAAVVPATAAWALVSPNGFGNPVRHNYQWIVNYPTAAISYAGLLPLALFMVAVLDRRTAWRDRSLIAIAVLFFLIAMHWTAVGRWINAIPPFSIAANDKLRFVCVLFVAIIAARTVNRSKAIAALAAVPLIALALYAYAKHQSIMRPSDLAGIASIGLFVFLPVRFAAVAVAAELFVLNAGYNALVDARYFRPPLPIVAVVRAHAPQEPFRIVGRDWVFLPNAAAQYGLEDVRGSDPMVSSAYDDYLRAFTVREPGTDVRRVVDADRGELDFLNVRFLIAEPDWDPHGDHWRLLYRGADGSLFENAHARSRFFGDAGATVLKIRQMSPMQFRLDVVAPRAARILSSEPAVGWQVKVDARGVQPISGVFLAFAVPAGRSAVEVVYRPVSFCVSLGLFLMGLVAVCAYPGFVDRLILGQAKAARRFSN